MPQVLDGINLLVSIRTSGTGDTAKYAALAFSTGCKVSTSTETGERITKESTSGKWADKFAKKFSETITADGCTSADGGDSMPSYDTLKRLQLAGEPVKVHYGVRGTGREADTTRGYEGMYLITQCDLDAPADGDATYSITLESNGEVKPIAGGLSES